MVNAIYNMKNVERKICNLPQIQNTKKKLLMYYERA